jgi:hypothetical protein
MAGQDQTAQVAAAEHLKEYIREIIYAFKDGAGHTEAPFTAELACSAIWHKVDQAFTDAFKAYAGTLRFRLTLPSGEEPPAFARVVTCRCLGAEGNNTQVYYVVCEVESCEQAMTIIRDYSGMGLFIRDWEYYA